jgi:hypothetical protein
VEGLNWDVARQELLQGKSKTSAGNSWVKLQAGMELVNADCAPLSDLYPQNLSSQHDW